MNQRLPITLVGGFLGSGKTSLLHHFISEHQGGHLAVLVENPGPLNLDAKALRGLCGVMRRQHDTVLEIPAGTEEVQIGWLAERLREFFQTGSYERVLIELSGLTNPARLARYFDADGSGIFAPWAELQQIICMVDALDFFRSEQSQTLPTVFQEFQRELIAGATLLVLNKCDLLTDQKREFCFRQLSQLNATAPIAETAYGEIPRETWSKRVIAPDGLGPRRAYPRPQATEQETPLLSVVYRVHRPFHPERFWHWFNADHPGFLRVKGIIWLATRNLLVGGVSRTRWQNSCGAAGLWWAALPREEWPEETEALRRMQETWREPYGDRRQELILIGEAALLSTTLRRELEACLLTDAEYALPVKAWSSFTDPFPVWDLENE